MAAAIQYILTAAQSLAGSQDYNKKSRMTILGLAGVLFCKNEQGYRGIDKIDCRMFRRKYLAGCLGLKATVRNRVTTRLSLYNTVFLFVSVSFNQSPAFTSRLCSKSCQDILDIVGLTARLRFEEDIYEKTHKSILSLITLFWRFPETPPPPPPLSKRDIEIYVKQ